MKNKSNISAIVFGTLAIGLLFAFYFLRKPSISWRPTFSKFHTSPYGNRALFELLPNLFPEQEIEVNRTNLYSFFSTYTSDSTNFILITRHFSPNRYMVNKMLSFVKKGNHIFISADVLMSYQTFLINSKDTTKDGFFNPIPRKSGEKTQVKLYVSNKNKWQPYTFDYFAADNYFDLSKNYTANYQDTSCLKELNNINTSNFEIYNFGKLNDTLPNLLKIIYGKGSMILCTNPLIFTNFNLLESGNSEYISNVLSELPVQKVIWDEYINSGPLGIASAGSPIRFILSQPALRSAYYLLMVLLILFLVFKSKRRQQTIPVVSPPVNTSKQFVEIIGRLYFNKSNPKKMGQKKARLFLAFISKKYNIDTQKGDQVFLTQLQSAKGVSQELIAKLNKGLERALNPNAFFSETDLIELSKNINTFKHH